MNADGTYTIKSEDLTKRVSICGANNYYADTNTIEFVVNGDLGCLVRLR